MSITEREKAVIDGGAAAAPDRRRVARRERRRDARGRGPVDRRDALRDRRRDPRGRPGGARRRVRRRRPSGRRSAPERARRDPPARLRAARRARRRAGAADDARDGQGGRRVEGRDHLRGRVLPLVLGRGAAHRRLLQDRRQRASPRAGDAPAGRPLLLHHPLELPQRDGHAQDRPGDRRRLHDGRQAGEADAALDAGAGGAARRVRPARRRPQRRHRLLLERDLRSRSSPTRGCASSPSPARPRSAAS